MEDQIAAGLDRRVKQPSRRDENPRVLPRRGHGFQLMRIGEVEDQAVDARLEQRRDLRRQLVLPGAGEDGEVPVTAGVKLHDLLSLSITAHGVIDHVVNDTGDPTDANTNPSDVVSYP